MTKATGQVKHTNLQLISDGLFKFSITMGGFIINGFTYNVRNRQIKFPSCKWGTEKRDIGRAHGIHIKRLRDRIEQELEERDERTIEGE